MVPPPVVVDTPLPRLGPPTPERVAPASSESVGKNAARCSRTAAQDSSTAAAAAATFWFDTATCGASWSSTGSLNSDHHGPRVNVSAGAAAIQPGGGSRYCAEAGASNFWFGARAVQAPSASRLASASVAWARRAGARDARAREGRGGVKGRGVPIVMINSLWPRRRRGAAEVGPRRPHPLRRRGD